MLAASFLAFNNAAHAEAGDWLIRARGIGVLPEANGTPTVIGGDVDIEDQFVPELDFTYFISNNLAAELILATTPHDVSVSGSALGDVDLGSVWLLPPTLSLQYHFLPQQKIRPYAGIGLNYTIFYNVDNGPIATDIDYDDSFGWSLQAGADFMINDRWSINADVKKLFLSTSVDVKALGATITSDVDIDPWIVGIGVGYHF
ncbi:MAG: OmpW family protein [Geminicoccaceae bacterium]